jgi:hypothetical protein
MWFVAMANLINIATKDTLRIISSTPMFPKYDEYARDDQS